ncbi:G1/S-specific cyclin-D2 [Hyalella azteca]|uniref:G1/S-specific cyclin-D2 n=1 Tax=Hyalella azteca TaxID=294128 RepID=A0A8B7NMA1_HYAAZ|nr:G1/S-specific cyclin-D2 [Hyalella azteca]
MDELLCTESSIPPGSSDQQTNNHTDNQPTCSYDATIFSDERVLDNLLVAQSLTQPSDQFLQPNKSNVTPNIRAVLVNWMLELCEHRNCEDQVFLVAVNLLDRFLNLVQVHRSQLQLAACSCLLLSSKLRQSSYLSVDILAYYTEDSVTSQEIIQWEQLILAKLSWNVSPVISYDFIEHLLQLLPLRQRIHLPAPELDRRGGRSLGHGRSDVQSLPVRKSGKNGDSLTL